MCCTLAAIHNAQTENRHFNSIKVLSLLFCLNCRMGSLVALQSRSLFALHCHCAKNAKNEDAFDGRTNLCECFILTWFGIGHGVKW